MDVRMMYLSSSVEIISFVDILVSDFEKDGNGQSATSSAILTSESSNLIDENEFLGYFGQETPKRYASYEWRFYIKEIGQKFEGGVEEFRVKLLKYAAEIGFEFVYVHNDKERITVECVNKCSEECGWRAHASRCSASGFFYLRSLNNIHNCKGVLREQHAKMMCSKVVSSVVIDMLREKRNIKPSDIMSSFKLDYGFDISYYLAWYGRELAKGALHGDDLSSYGQLTWYIDSLMSTNPDTHCVLECAGESSRFKRLFVCFEGCIEGFRYCRPLLFLDGTFLKGKYKGQLLGATAKNGNQGFFPFAFAIVDSENEENWSWFMQNLHTVLAPQGRILTFISDRCIRLIQAVKDIFPTAHHGFCYFHLKQNLLSKFPASFGKIYRDRIIFLFMKCAYTPTVTGFHYYMKILLSEGGKRVLQFLKNLPLKN